MSVEDEIHWARGHAEQFERDARAGAPLQQTIDAQVGFMRHVLAALEELRSQAESFRGPRRVEVDDQ